MGSPDDDPDARDNEKPQHEVWLAGYYIDRYPVTNEHYRAFLEAGGYEQREFWSEAGWAKKEEQNWTEPRFWDDESYNQPRQPVVGVSWYEALAYARWAGVMLPSEAHWEKAAGWDPVAKHKRKYPWGDAWEESKGNWGGKHDAPTPVGQYPEDRSAFGLLDVAGNVYEWTSTRYQEFPYDGQDGREDISGQVRRTLKGCADWSDSIDDAKGYARCGYRARYDPWYRFFNRGFRCMIPHAFSPDSDS
jgi:formylglycine-generating enzyme required for sulfatase activity